MGTMGHLPWGKLAATEVHYLSCWSIPHIGEFFFSLSQGNAFFTAGSLIYTYMYASYTEFFKLFFCVCVLHLKDQMPRPPPETMERWAKITVWTSKPLIHSLTNTNTEQQTYSKREEELSSIGDWWRSWQTHMVDCSEHSKVAKVPHKADDMAVPGIDND